MSITREQIKEMVSLQNHLNSMIDQEWFTKNNNWVLASMVELAEGIDHIGWKWWKKQTSNQEQAAIELVDVFHFQISQVIEYVTSDLNSTIVTDEVLEKSTDVIFEYVNRGFISASGSLDTVMSNAHIVDALTYMIQHPEVVLGSAMVFAEKLGMPPQRFFQTYIAKNVLNVFRQNNGYKTGEYRKEISFDGEIVEDNVVLEKVMATMPIESITYDNLYAEFQEAYNNG